jgi:ferredoxin-NADP reductase
MATTRTATHGASSDTPVTEAMTEPDAPPAHLRWQQAAIKDIVVRSPRAKSFFLAPASPFSFIAGQHAEVRLTAEDGYAARRSYSIASAPDSESLVELAIERLMDGEVSPFFHDIAEIGDMIEMRGPIGGYFNWSPLDHDPILLIGGGSGVAPLVSMVRHRAGSASTAPVVLLFSARTSQDILFAEELRALDARRDGFRYLVTLTRDEPAAGADYHRRIDAAMIADCLTLLPGRPKRVYVCGSNVFCTAAADAALQSGIAAEMIRTERYGQ